MKRRTFYVYSDPGHAWIKVPKLFLAVQIGAYWRKHFTCFSYEKGDYVYLEQDCDTAVFIKLMRQVNIEPVFKEGSTCATRYSRIRRYAQLAPM